MKRAHWSLALAALVALAAGAGRLSAQATTGSVTGTVRADNEAAAGTQVVVRNPATGFSRSVVVGPDGHYLIAGLEPGRYEVSTQRIGYAPATRTATVTLGQLTPVDFNLTAQAVEVAGITVRAGTETGLISPSRTGTLTTVSDSALRRLPSLNRNFTDFVVLTPQVSTTLPNGGLSAGGVNNRYNQVQIDGSNETDLFGLGSTGQPGGQANGKSIGIEAVKEYQVLLAPFDVRHGNFAGMLINAVTKSGTNDFHGSLYGFGRNQSLTRTEQYLNDYSQYQYGLSVGGPIVKDKALFFFNAERQSYSSPMTGIYLGAPDYNVSATDVNAAKQALESYGLPTGSAGLVKVHNPLTNVFARLDFPDLGRNSTLTLRYNYGSATSEAIYRDRSGTSPTLALTSNQYQYASKKNAPALELRTHFANGGYNELLASYTRIRDPRTATGATDAPQVSVGIPGATIQAGTERYSQGNQVNQDIAEITDNVTLPFGKHTLVLGTQNTYYKAHNLYAQSINGVWTFDSVDSLRAGQAYSYIVGVPAVGDGSVNFRTLTLSGYAQDQWALSPTFNLNYGLRVDVPTFLDKPPTNPDVVQEFGRNTAEIPSGHLQFSPRVGFNWDMTGDERNQLRGGIGTFTGPPAYVWLSNAFQNSGLTGVNLLTCTRSAPAFNAAAIASPPTECANGNTARAGSEIDLVQSGFHMPQTLRASAGYDRDLGHDLVGTVEGLFTKAIYAPFYYNMALTSPVGTDANGRVLYGTKPYAPSLVGSRSTVIDVANENKDHFYNLTGKLARRFAGNWEGTVAYTYSRGWDVQSFSSSTAYSQYRYGRVWAGNQLDKTATRSSFEQRNRIVAHGSYTFPTLTTVSLIYTGASGTPYNFVYASDLNGDGLSYNDPIYVPTDATDPTQIQFADYTSGGQTVTAAQQAAAFNQFINDNSCLSSQRGQIMARNSCTAPWTNILNVSLRQSLNTFSFQNVSLQLDVFNFMNLLNKDWGHVTTTYSDVSLLSYNSLPSRTLVNNQATFTFNPDTKIFDYNRLESNYQMQLSLRYSF